MKKNILPLLGLALALSVGAQNQICITYDAAGNRTKRETCCPTCMPAIGGSGIAVDESAMDGAQDRKNSAEKTLSTIKIVPNPSTGIFALTGDELDPNAQVGIFGPNGDLLLYRTLADGRFDLSGMPSGTYVVHIIYRDTRKVLLLEKSSH